MSTDAAIPTKHAGAMIDSSFILVIFVLMVKEDKGVVDHQMSGGWKFLYPGMPVPPLNYSTERIPSRLAPALLSII